MEHIVNQVWSECRILSVQLGLPSAWKQGARFLDGELLQHFNEQWWDYDSTV